ncbi:hypothetical protein BJ742DRAFT_735139 [Cladochytrium replicatum]|nr:hypothetical protein BJ742DRAFT_735139 [Cladochytrium replicatum]
MSGEACVAPLQIADVVIPAAELNGSRRTRSLGGESRSYDIAALRRCTSWNCAIENGSVNILPDMSDVPSLPAAVSGRVAQLGLNAPSDPHSAALPSLNHRIVDSNAIKETVGQADPNEAYKEDSRSDQRSIATATTVTLSSSVDRMSVDLGVYGATEDWYHIDGANQHPVDAGFVYPSLERQSTAAPWSIRNHLTYRPTTRSDTSNQPQSMVDARSNISTHRSSTFRSTLLRPHANESLTNELANAEYCRALALLHAAETGSGGYGARSDQLRRDGMWLMKLSAAQQHPDALLYLARFEVVSKRPLRAVHAYRRAARAMPLVAWYELARLYEFGAADAGNEAVAASVELQDHHPDIMRVERGTHAIADERDPGKNSFVTMMRSLSRSFAKKPRTIQNDSVIEKHPLLKLVDSVCNGRRFRLARHCYTKAANHGNPRAMRRLATAYVRGELNVSVDQEEAKRWLAMARSFEDGVGPNPTLSTLDQATSGVVVLHPLEEVDRSELLDYYFHDSDD